MAINQAEKAKNIAIEAVAATDQLMAALERLRSLEEERAGAGIDLPAFDETYEGVTGLKHIDGAALNSVLNTSVPALWAFLTDNFHDDNLQKVRP